MNISKISIPVFFFLITGSVIHAQQRHNYDESKVPDFVLPSILQDKKGNAVKTVHRWENSRRQEILHLFEEHVYGKPAGEQVNVVYQTISLQEDVLAGQAVKKEVKVLFTAGEDTVDMNILIYLPKSREGPAPVFLGLNFYGNHSIHDDPGIMLHQKWVRNNEDFGITGHRATEKSRGVRAYRWPVEAIIQRGYGLATIYYGDLFPDHKEGTGDGVQRLFRRAEVADSTGWGAIATWAWGLSRAMDYFENDSGIDQSKVIVMGHSRLGKTSLWAGACDPRFAAVIANNSGCGGAALFRRRYGETIEIINNNFPHWFCQNFHRFDDAEDDLPVDQHMLISLIAPRPVYVASAVEDRWADPKGEFLSVFHASEVYRLYGLQGIKKKNMPPLNEPILSSRVGYHIRRGGHDVTRFDWDRFMDFADLHVK